jgi:methionyl-tRNA formyltransferase
MALHIVYFGTSGAFSRLPLESLLMGGSEVSAVVIPAASAASEPFPRRIKPTQPTSSALPIIDPYLTPNIVHRAWAHHVPVWEIGSLSDPPTLALLTGLRPDLIVVACFPFILPAAVLQLPRYGCLNLHPSLLPAYRGPIPIFWMARQGEPQAGVTLHFMDEGVDTGDIVAQTAFEWRDGISGMELEQCCAAEGGRLLVEAVQQLARSGQLRHWPQPQTCSSYFSWPTDKELVIPTNWSARRAFNFLRAATDWPLLIAVGTERFPVAQALGYEANQTLAQPYWFESGELLIQFQPGVLRIR